MKLKLFFLFFLISKIIFCQAKPFSVSGDIFGCRVFIENKGQFSKDIPDGNNVKFGYINGDEKVFFSPNGLSYLLEKKYVLTEHQREEVEHGEKFNPKPIKRYLVNMVWENANPNIQIEESEKQSWYHSYGDEKLKSNCYKKITYKNVYDNIDIEYVFTDDKTHGVKYNLILHPGAKLSDIKIKYTGNVDGIKIKNGNVVIKTPLDDIVEHFPFSYQNGEKIESNFVVNNNLISFELPEGYNQNQELVIDPWVTSLTTLTSNNYGYDVDYDYAGNLYVFGGITTYKIAKYDPSGTLLWTFSGVLATPAWTSSGNYPYPLIGNFIVDKFSQKSYTGQGYFGSGTRIIRIDGNGLYNNYITTQNSLWQECWDFGLKCSTGEILGFGGDNSGNKTGSVINQTTGAVSPNSFNPTFSSPGQDVVNNAIDDNGDVFVIYASVQTTFLNNKISKINTALNNNVWIVPSQYLTLKENENKSSYIGAGLVLGSSNGFNCLAVNNSYLYYYDGFNLAAYDKNTGTRLGFTTIAGQTPRTMGGIALDDCNNVYVGGNNLIKSYNFNGTVFSALPSITLNTTSTNKYVYDLKLDKNTNLLYASGSGFSGVYSAINSLTCSNIQLSISQTCVGNNNATAVATLTTNILNPVISYSWTNSSGVLVGQTNNTSSLTNTITNLTNGIYTIYSQINAPCGPVNSQTVNINCTSQTSQNCPGSLLFDATHPAVDMPSGNQYYSGTNGGYTWECWFKLNQPFGTAMRPLISAVDGVLYEDQWFGFGWQGGWFNEPVTNLVFKVDGPNSVAPTGPNCAYAPPGGFVIGTWYHAAGVMDYTNQISKLFVNGVLVDSKPITTVPITRVIPAQLCLNWGGTPLSLFGNMDEVRIWERPVTDAEILANYNHCLTGNEQNLLVYYRCNQPGGSTVIDATPNNNAGTFSNLPSWSTQQPIITGTACATSSPTLTSSNSNSVICAGTTVTLSVSGVTSYTWNTGVTNSDIVVTPPVTTTYTVTTDLSACSGATLSSIITVSVISTPTISISSSSSVLCSNQTNTLTASGATSYTWSSSPSLSSTTGSLVTTTPIINESYTIIGAIGTCTNSAIYSLTVNPSPTVTIASPSSTLCSGQSTTLTANGANTFTWSPSATLSSSSGSIVVASPLSTVNYTVIGSLNSCTNSAITTVSVLPTPTLTISSNTSICLGTTISSTLTANGANSYTWTNSSSLSSSTGSVVVASPNATTVYTVTGTAASCSNTAAITVSVNPSPTISAVSFTNTSCGLSNGSILVTSLPANNTYTWSGGITSTTNTASSLASGIYSVTAINGACQTTTVVNILSSLPLLITSTTITPSDCNLNNGSIIVNDNYVNSNYSWSPNVSSTSSPNNLSAGNYALTITNGACSTSSVFVIVQLNGPSAIIATQSDAICESSNGSINIVSVTDGTAPFQYNFNNTGFSSISTYSNLAQGIYTITVKDAHGCFYNQTFSIDKSMINLTIDLISNSPTCDDNDGSFIINNFTSGTPPYYSSFNNGVYSSNLIFDQLGIGTYSLNVRDSNMCETGYILTMQENGDYTLYIPNTFTPNNNKVNDIWYVKGTCLDGFNCLIYNRWGEKIKELTDIKEGWDGTYKGNPVPDGVYVYVIEVKTKKDVIKKSGHITIFR